MFLPTGPHISSTITPKWKISAICHRAEIRAAFCITNHPFWVLFQYKPMIMNPRLLFLLLTAALTAPVAKAQHPLAVIGYYAGRSTAIDSFPTRELTHIIFSFCHLEGTQLHVSNAGDTTTIRMLVALKETHPALKVILSLGGWGGCKTCPDV